MAQEEGLSRDCLSKEDVLETQHILMTDNKH